MLRAVSSHGFPCTTGSPAARLGNVATAPPDDSKPSRRVVEQRVRNRVIEYLEIAASFEIQLDYQRAVPAVSVPGEVINQWEDWVHVDPRTDAQLSAVYSQDEARALGSFHATWSRVADGTPNPLPSIAETQQLPEWDELRQAAISTLAVFERRGKMPEDREI
jgi:hypothetical protein